MTTGFDRMADAQLAKIDELQETLREHLDQWVGAHMGPHVLQTIQAAANNVIQQAIDRGDIDQEIHCTSVTRHPEHPDVAIINMHFPDWLERRAKEREQERKQARVSHWTHLGED